MIVADDNALALLPPVAFRPSSRYSPLKPRNLPRPGARFAGRPGLGDAAQIVGATSSIGTPVLTGALAAHAASTAAATGSAATILGMSPALAVPIIGAAIVGITMGIIALLRSGCGQTCIITSQWANQAEPLLAQNIQAYFSLPAPRTRQQQQMALNNFEVVWAKLQELCGQPGTGDAGVRCITDRQAGACKWKQTSDSPLLQYPGEPQPGQCWNWFSGYRDPIANDPVVDDAQAALSSVGSTVSSVVNSLPAVTVGGMNLTPILLLALAGGVVWAVAS